MTERIEKFSKAAETAVGSLPLLDDPREAVWATATVLFLHAWRRTTDNVSDSDGVSHSAPVHTKVTWTGLADSSVGDDTLSERAVLTLKVLSEQGFVTNRYSFTACA